MWEGRTVSVAAARKRVSRGVQLLEEAMRRRAWDGRENGLDSRARSPR
jgi:hypothetical protein